MIDACEVTVTYDCTDPNACTKVVETFIPNGEGTKDVTGPTLTLPSEKDDICQAGILNNDAQLKTQCPPPDVTESDLKWDGLACYKEIETKYFDGTEPSPQFET